MKFTFSDVSVVMATKNEEKAIGKVIKDIKKASKNKAEIIIVDSSNDRTPKIARSLGAKVITQPPRGYAAAMLAAVTAPKRDVVMTLDCDDTYPVERMPLFLDLINQGYDVVSGVRLMKSGENITRLNYLGNKLFALLSSVLFLKSFSDVTTGMRAYRRSVLSSINWKKNIESSGLLLRAAAKGYRIKEVPIPYRTRIGDVKLDPFKGGYIILKSIIKSWAVDRF